ncbi:MAG: hypothetical protein AAB403_18555 [Planctomycetota bacterium]
MISESWYWRTDLMKFASSLRKRANQKRWTDPSLCRCEQLIMVGFFYVRKLIDSRKLSRDFADRQIKLTAYPSTGKHVHLMNVHHDLDEFFDMGTHQQKTAKIEQIANQVIHSYIFYLVTEESGPLQGIIVASDVVRDRELLEFSLSDVIKIFELAGKGEDDKAITLRYDDKRQDYVMRIFRDAKRR